MWYDINKTLSHNKLLNFVVGPRGVGKTYSAKKRVIKNFLKDGAQFVYLRRYETELKTAMLKSFFSDVGKEFPDEDLEYHKGGTFRCNGEICGWPLSLTKASQFKSVPFPDVTMIIFDEFIIDAGFIRYLPAEVETFNEMYSTIARLRDVTVFFLSNAITYTNPYFLYYGLSVPPDKTIYKKGDMLVEYVDSPEYIEAAQETRFGKIIKDTNYGKYAIENQFLRDSNALIQKMPEGCKARAILKIDNHLLGLYTSPDKSYFVSSKYDASTKYKVTFDKGVDTEDYVSHTGGLGSIVKYEIQANFYNQTLWFSDMTAKNLVVRKILGGI